MTCTAPPHDIQDHGGFDWRKEKTNRRDELLDFVFADGNLAVESIQVNLGAYVSIYLAAGLSLEIFPNDSQQHEHWRLFRPYTNDPHFVVTGTGIVNE